MNMRSNAESNRRAASDRAMRQPIPRDATSQAVKPARRSAARERSDIASFLRVLSTTVEPVANREAVLRAAREIAVLPIVGMAKTCHGFVSAAVRILRNAGIGYAPLGGISPANDDKAAILFKAAVWVERGDHHRAPCPVDGWYRVDTITADTGRPFVEGGAYTSDNFADYRGVVALLVSRGFTDDECNATLRNRWMRHIADDRGEDVPYGQVPTGAVAAALDRMTDVKAWARDMVPVAPVVASASPPRPDMPYLAARAILRLYSDAATVACIAYGADRGCSTRLLLTEGAYLVAESWIRDAIAMTLAGTWLDVVAALRTENMGAGRAVVATEWRRMVADDVAARLAHPAGLADPPVPLPPTSWYAERIQVQRVGLFA